MLAEKETGFVLMGGGHIGERHAAILQNLPGVALRALVEVNAGRRNALADRYKIPAFASWSDYLAANLSTQILLVATPNFLHADHAVAGLNARLHVICEKPLALTAEDGQRILDTARMYERQVFCMQQLVFSPALAFARELVVTGQLGAIERIEITAFWNRDERYYTPISWHGRIREDGGPLFTQFSHFVHALLWLCGPVKAARADFQVLRNPPLTQFEDAGQVNLSFESGPLAKLNYSIAASPGQIKSELVISGSKGEITLSGQYLQEIKKLAGPDLVKPALPILSPTDLQTRFIEHVLTHLAGNLTFGDSAAAGLAVVKLIQNLYQSRFKPVRSINP